MGMQNLNQDKIKAIKKSIVTNITQHDASLNNAVQGNRIYTMREKENMSQSQQVESPTDQQKNLLIKTNQSKENSPISINGKSADTPKI